MITSTYAEYADALEASLKAAGYTVSRNGVILTVELGSPAESITFTATAQWRIKNIVVTYQK